MTKLTKTTKSKYFQGIITKMMKRNSNTNIKGDMSFAQVQAQKDAHLNSLHNMLVPVCGQAQADQIVDTIRLGQRGETIVDCLPLMAVGETMAMMRNEVHQSIRKVRSYKTVEAVIELEQARDQQNCQEMIAIYWMVQKAYYTLYKRFMIAVDRPSINYVGGM